MSDNNNEHDVDYWYSAIEEKMQYFIQNELFDWGWWDGDDEEAPLEWMRKNFEVKTIVEYVGD